MNEEKKRIENMLAEGRIKQEEADGLLAALEKSEKKESISALAEHTQEPPLCKMAILGVLGVPAAIVICLILSAIAAVQEPPAQPNGPVGGSSFGCFGFLVIFIGEILSIEALVKILKNPGKWRGKWLAITGIILPVVIVLLMALTWIAA